MKNLTIMALLLVTTNLALADSFGGGGGGGGGGAPRFPCSNVETNLTCNVMSNGYQDVKKLDIKISKKCDYEVELDGSVVLSGGDFRQDNSSYHTNYGRMLHFTNYLAISPLPPSFFSGAQFVVTGKVKATNVIGECVHQ